MTFKTKVNLTNPPSSVTLSTKKGNIYLQASSALVGSGATGSTTYTITGGTKTYANATGLGSVNASYSLAKGKLGLTIHFS